MPIPSPRASTFGLQRAVVTGHHLASQSALRVLREGGSLVDAMVAASCVMTVALPHATTLGGCGMMLYYDAASRTVQALNGTGRAPGLASLGACGPVIGPRGPATWAVPGLPRLWEQAHRRHGRLAWDGLFADAVALAEQGIGCSSELARNLQNVKPAVVRQPGFAALFQPDGNPLSAGDCLRQPALAETLRAIAAEGAAVFYEGHIARSLETFSLAHGGLLRMADLRGQEAEWRESVSQDLRDMTVHVMPPNSLGVLMLAQLEAIAPHLAGTAVERSIAQIQIGRLCIETLQRRVADPAARWPAALDQARLAERLAARAREPEASGARDPGDTAGIVLADAGGNALVMLQSVFQPFGSGCVDPGTGILLNNRMIEFDMDPASPNALAPGKRPAHTLNPYLVMRAGRPMLLGVSPGGVSQTTTGAQVIANACFDGMPLTDAIDAPRWSISRGGDILLEPGFLDGVAGRLRAAGVAVEENSLHEFYFGSAKAIRLRGDGVFEAAADLRRQACALAE